MQNSGNYKVFSRKKFAIIMVILVSIVAVGVWVSLDRLAEYGDELEELAVTEPLEAAATLKMLTRTFAILNGMVLSSLAVLIIWHGWSGWRSESMPPKGSWILEGQRTWTGESAVRIAKFNVVAGVLLGVLGVASSLILWGLGDTGEDQTSKGACIHGHEMNQFAFRNASNDSTHVASVKPA
jgi:hypothetical protein